MSENGGLSLDFKLIRTVLEFHALEADWQELFSKIGRGPQLFQSYNWIWHWINCYHNTGNELLILTGRDQGELVLIAPLVCEYVHKIKMIKWIGEPVSQYGDILLKDDRNNLQWLKDGFNFLYQETKPDIFYLRKTRFDSSITPLLENYDATIIEETAAPYIETLGAQTFTEFNKRYSQRNRKSKRRHRRKLEEKGTLTFSFHKEGPSAKTAASKAVQLKRNWIKSMGLVSPAFMGKTMDRFFETACDTTDHPAGLRVSELCLDDLSIAMEIGITVKNYYGAHLGAYNKSYNAHSPGSLQMQDTIAALIEDGVEIIDLFAPCDPYKLEWTDKSVPVYDFSYATTLKGQIYEKCYLQHLRPTLKAVLLRLSNLKIKTDKFLKKKQFIGQQDGQS